MKCPTCTETALVMSDRQGVEIDYCPKCRGVWLDRGELDKIIQRASAELASAARASAAQQPLPAAPVAGYRQGGQRDDRHHSGHNRKSIWKELFD